MADATPPKIYALNFNIKTDISEEIVTKFFQAQANLLGLKGYIQKEAENNYKGALEGDSVIIDKFNLALDEAEEFKNQDFDFSSQTKEIQTFTMESFEVLNQQ
ncbi:uncharacterized protein LOC119673120 [Teleopsis dalmanni]|uniref:uncharacterized protein LOC119673120 n=1 Tax=Teleopsis dalmanni TaxID=139649 RepID=UPI0018CE9B8C|nr:uncharacterized protein LOC119673120 [Teleopsis dalmanni]